MSDTLISFDNVFRLGAFAIMFVVMALWELKAPRRLQAVGRNRRWPSNLGLVALNTIVVRIVFPMSAVALAMLVERQGAGLLHALEVPPLLAVLLALVLLDLAIYLQHVLFHSLPVLWRLHRMHHSDVEFDSTNGLRFHPLEMILSMIVKFAVIAALGAPAAAVLAFEIVLNAAAMFNHGNVKMPTGLDRMLRWFIVTPDMHRVHHSLRPEETHSNFGFNLPWWDRLFGTYRAQPQDGHVDMQLGLPLFREPRWLRLDRLLIQPWVGAGRRGAGRCKPAPAARASAHEPPGPVAPAARHQDG
jgi:sterol desaturase/sphingolipid hydroxylase (fatty acid hydroxylase superfamily)